LYLIRKGADVQTIYGLNLRNTHLDVIKILVQNGYKFTNEILEYQLIRCFVNDNHLDNVHYFIGLGAEIQWMFDYENAKYESYLSNKSIILYNKQYNKLKSPLEYIVSMGKMNHAKFLVDNYYNLIGPEINRLLIIAAANGQCEMALYFYDLNKSIGNSLNQTLGNRKEQTLEQYLLTVACFFGHVNMFNLLLTWEIDLYATPLFMTVIDGSSKKGKRSQIYDILTKGNNIFRNDVYHYGDEHMAIMKLLIKHNVQCKYWQCFVLIPVKLWDADVLRHFLSTSNDFDINKKFRANWHEYDKEKEFSLLEISIFRNRIDITEVLLQHSTNAKITSNYALETIKNNVEFNNLLLKYGVNFV
jgi:hypothetical protein